MPYCVRRFLPAVETGATPFEKKRSGLRGGYAAPQTTPSIQQTPVMSNAGRHLHILSLAGRSPNPEEIADGNQSGKITLWIASPLGLSMTQTSNLKL